VFIRLLQVMAATAVAALATASATGSTAAAESSSEVPKPCSVGRVVCVDKSAQTVDWVVDGEIRLRMAARFGDVAGYPTREGTFRIYRKSERHVSRLYGDSMPYSLFFDGGQAVHYSEDFAENGYGGASHGCVNTRNIVKMRTLFRAAKLGDRVYVYASGRSPRNSDPGYNPWAW